MADHVCPSVNRDALLERTELLGARLAQRAALKRVRGAREVGQRLHVEEVLARLPTVLGLKVQQHPCYHGAE